MSSSLRVKARDAGADRAQSRPMADEPGARQFTPEEAEEILRRALQRQSETGVSREDLVSAAREVGVSEKALLEAADEVERGRSERAVTERLRAEKRASLVSHATVYAVVSVGLFLLNLATNMATVTDQVPRWWSLFPLVGWGIAVAVHAVRSLRHPEPSADEVRSEVAREAEEARAADAERTSRSRDEDAVAMLTRLSDVMQRTSSPAARVRVGAESEGAPSSSQSPVEVVEQDHEAQSRREA